MDENEDQVVVKREEAFLDIDLGMALFPVFLRDPKTGERKGFALQELGGPDRDAYMNDISSRMRYDGKGNPAGMKNFTNFQASVITRGFFEASLVEDEAVDPSTGERSSVIRVESLGKKVPESQIRLYPGRVQKALFDKLMEISGLTERAEELAKND